MAQHMSTQARRRLSWTMQPEELRDLAKEIAEALQLDALGERMIFTVLTEGRDENNC